MPKLGIPANLFSHDKGSVSWGGKKKKGNFGEDKLEKIRKKEKNEYDLKV